MCPFCDRAKALCVSQEYQFTYKQLDIDFTREELLELFPDARTFPQIKIDGQRIGGYDQLKTWHDNTRRIDDYEDNPSDIDHYYE